jgi:HSP20 family protein
MKTLRQHEENPVVQQPETTYVAPPVDIEEQPDEYRLLADMPGVGKNDLDVVLDGNELTVTGHRRLFETNGDYLHRESRAHSFRRTFQLDPTIDGAGIVAKVEDGVLTVRLPKTEAVKPRRIEVAG